MVFVNMRLEGCKFLSIPFSDFRKKNPVFLAGRVTRPMPGWHPEDKIIITVILVVKKITNSGRWMIEKLTQLCLEKS
jgi:hypothetical protein